MKFPWTTSITDVLKNDTKIDEKLQHIVKGKEIINICYQTKKM